MNTRTGTLGATVTQTYLGSGVGGRVSSLLVQFDNSAAWDGSITIVGRVQRDGTGIDKPLTALAYKNMTSGSNATAALTGDALILVDASGMDVFADVTTVTTGSSTFTAMQLAG